METNRICAPGRNCWRIADAERAAVLIDGDAYFSALAEALERAQNSVFIIGWQLDSRMRLSGAGKECPAFGDFLHRLVHQNRRLRIYILLWDFAMIYAADREIIPLYSHPWRTHRRIHLWLDSNHPIGASHHQKIVVVDDTVAFAGGLDLAERRWDTPEHALHDPRRVDSVGLHFPPYHDVQVMVDAQAAAALGELARDRWRRATGESLAAGPPPLVDPWPPGRRPDFRAVPVAIARTEAAYLGRPGMREVEALFFDSIRAARRLIYIENQYFTSASVGEVLAARLQEESGPEIIMVLPNETSEWLERVTMAVLRARLIKRLREADRFHRLRIYYPFVQTAENEVRVHAKVSIIDDRLARVGSSNLNNRSMGLDSECDVAIEAADPATAAAIQKFRHRLVGEHLGVSPEAVAARYQTEASLARAIESLQGGNRTLRDLNPVVSEYLDAMIPEAAILDPERALEPEEMVDLFFPAAARRRAAPRFMRFSVVLAAAALLILMWRSTPFAAWIDIASVKHWSDILLDSPLAPLWVAGAFTIGTILLIPVTLLIVATAALFGPWLGFTYAICGSLASAAVTYGIGKLIGKQAVRRFAGAMLQRVERQISRQGLLSMLIARVVPLAPFVIVNFAAGAKGFRLFDFMIATVVGMSPGIMALALLEYQLDKTLRDPTVGGFALLSALAVFFGGLGVVFYRWYSRRRASRAS